MPQTQAAVGNVVRGDALDLGSLYPGDTVTLVTVSDSRYYITLTVQKIVHRDDISGVTVMGGSRRFGQIRANPNRLRVDRWARIGQPFNIGQDGNTSDLKRIEVNGAYRAG